MTTRMVLVPGFWLGSFAWDEVLPHLPSDIDAHALTLPGQSGTASDEEVTLEDQVDAIVDAVDKPADRRVLVVHSGSANPGTMALDRRPDLIDRVIYVDTAPPMDGVAMYPEADKDFTVEDMLADPAEKESFAGLDDAQLATLRERAVPQPRGLVSAPVSLSNDQRFDVPISVVCCVYPSEDFKRFAEQGVPFLAALLSFKHVNWIDLPTGHWPMWSKPAELAEVLAEEAER